MAWSCSNKMLRLRQEIAINHNMICFFIDSKGIALPVSCGFGGSIDL